MNSPILITVDGGPVGTLDAFLRANAGLVSDAQLAAIQSLGIGESYRLESPNALPTTITRHPNATAQIAARPAPEEVTASEIADARQRRPSRFRRIAAEEKTCAEPLLVIAEGETGSAVYGCGACGCAHDGTPPSKAMSPGMPKIVRFEEFLVDAEGPTSSPMKERPLSDALLAQWNKGPIAGHSCIPPWRTENDPERFRAIYDEAVRNGPVTKPSELYLRIRDAIAYQKQEMFVAVLLDTELKVIGVVEIARGTIDHVEVSVPDVLRVPIVKGAHGTILVHNHPSGNPHPSESDRLLTLDLAKAFETNDMLLMDHVIAGAKKHYSFAEHGVL